MMTVEKLTAKAAAARLIAKEAHHIAATLGTDAARATATAAYRAFAEAADAVKTQAAAGAKAQAQADAWDTVWRNYAG